MLKLKCLNRQNIDSPHEIIIGIYETTCINEVVQEFSGYLPRQLQTVIDQEEINHFKHITTIHTFKTTSPQKIHILGLGPEKELTEARLRQAVAFALGATKGRKSIGLYIEPNPIVDNKTMFQIISESFYLGTYMYDSYKTTPQNRRFTNQLVVYVAKGDFGNALAGKKLGEIFAKGTNLARTLMNQPGNKLTPEILKNEIVQMAKKHAMSYEVLDKRELNKLGMGGMLSVAQGSQEMPYVVTVSYKGNKYSDDCIGLVGKGVTFDTGGLQLKNSAGLHSLKKDMGGAATMIGVLDIIGRLKPKINVVLVIGCVDNMISGSAYRPGDVISMMQGKTVEIISTDAEGRLVLADCITYAKKLGVTSLVDCATLTGSCRIALGYFAAGVMGNDEQMLQEFLQTSEKAGERAWPLPMFPEYRAELNSRIADLKNCAVDVAADASIAAKFIEAFVADTPWLHLDISSSGFIYEDTDVMAYGATGAMVRTIALFIWEASSQQIKQAI